MAVYINGIGSVSAQKTWDSISFFGEVKSYHARMMQCLEPEIDFGIDDKYLRRMSRLIRMGWISARVCLQDAGIKEPDAVITGSGWGSVGDSEKFLLSIYRNNENLLPPTPFIQSTHNAVGAQIAMLLDNYEYNMTYAHLIFAFEHALLDAMLRIGSGESSKILCGGFDEITDNQFTLYDRLDWWRKEPAESIDMIKCPGEGSIAGEGFNFFLLQQKKSLNTYAEVKWVKTFFTDKNEALTRISKSLKEEKIDWVFLGLSGDSRADRVSRDVISELFNSRVNVAAWKHLSGEYLTSSGFALWSAAMAMKRKAVPAIMHIETPEPGRIPGKVLIYNHHKGKYHSFILLSNPAR